MNVGLSGHVSNLELRAVWRANGMVHSGLTLTAEGLAAGTIRSCVVRCEDNRRCPRGFDRLQLHAAEAMPVIGNLGAGLPAPSAPRSLRRASRALSRARMSVSGHFRPTHSASGQPDVGCCSVGDRIPLCSETTRRPNLEVITIEERRYLSDCGPFSPV